MKKFIWIVCLILLIGCGSNSVSTETNTSSNLPLMPKEEEVISHDVDKAYETIQAYFQEMHDGNITQAVKYLRDDFVQHEPIYDFEEDLRKSISLDDYDEETKELIINSGFDYETWIINLAKKTCAAYYHKLSLDMNHVMDEGKRLTFQGAYETAEEDPLEVLNDLDQEAMQEKFLSRIISNQELMSKYSTMSEKEIEADVAVQFFEFFDEEINRLLEEYDQYIEKKVTYVVELQGDHYYIVDIKE